MASTSSTKKMTLLSCDGKTFEIDEAVILESTIMDLIEADDTETPITSKILAMVIEYCKKHHVKAAAFAEEEKKSGEDVPKEDDLEKWDAEFVNVDYVTLFELFRAAAYLGVDSLLKLTCRTVTSRDFSPEEEEEINKENQWDFER